MSNNHRPRPTSVRYCEACGIAYTAATWAHHRCVDARVPAYCSQCGAQLIPTGSGQCCPQGHGRIQPGGMNRGDVQPANPREAGKVISEYLRLTTQTELENQ